MVGVLTSMSTWYEDMDREQDQRELRNELWESLRELIRQAEIVRAQRVMIPLQFAKTLLKFIDEQSPEMELKSGA